MDKRYQIFVSSTFADLKEERRRILQTLMEMDCIPAGMELFPAADEEQWAFIRKVIDDCDYYLLVIGGRYGSTTPEGISYTEKEYDYAVKKGLKVLALLHDKPDEIPAGKTELDPVLRARLASFREKAATGRLVRFWNRAEDLPGLVALSLAKTIKTYPAVGWVRADALASEDVLNQVNRLRQENDSLRAAVDSVDSVPTMSVENVAGLEDIFAVQGSYMTDYGRSPWESKLTWKEIFGYIAPYLAKHPTDAVVKSELLVSLVKRDKIRGRSHMLDDQFFQTISIQLKVLGLVKIEYLKATNGSMGLFWSLTSTGEQLMFQIRTVLSVK